MKENKLNQTEDKPVAAKDGEMKHVNGGLSNQGHFPDQDNLRKQSVGAFGDEKQYP